MQYAKLAISAPLRTCTRKQVGMKATLVTCREPSLWSVVQHRCWRRAFLVICTRRPGHAVITCREPPIRSNMLLEKDNFDDMYRGPGDAMIACRDLSIQSNIVTGEGRFYSHIPVDPDTQLSRVGKANPSLL